LSAIVIITTVGTEDEANRLARELVGRRHAACVNVLPIHRSVYRWRDKLCEDSELMLLIKSVEDEYPAIEAAILELHSYELPEILRFSVNGGEEKFLNWLADSVQKKPARMQELEE
jgi:periplasmic divalent cation tolerance protein